jgi:predicted dehydrogenase
MNIGIIGCGFVADLYMRSLTDHAQLKLVAAADHDRARARAFQAHWDVPVVASLDELLADSRIEIVVNLTNPGAHYTINRRALAAGRHVYCEKPLAMDYSQALELVELAETQRLQLSAAPCSLLGEAAQTLWRALRADHIGPVRLVYAELDDDYIPLAPYRRWFSESGAPWPADDEFQVGCTLEHAGYYLSWLAAFFGPARSVTAYSTVTIADKGEGLSASSTPDFSVACIEFESGVVCRLTCSIVAPHDHRLRVVGDRGVIEIEDCWFYRTPVKLRRRWFIRRRMLLAPIARRLRLCRAPGTRSGRRGAAAMDFARGIAELADAVAEQRNARLSPRFSLHITELALAIQNAGPEGGHYRMQSRFDPIEPMPWAV